MRKVNWEFFAAVEWVKSSSGLRRDGSHLVAKLVLVCFETYPLPDWFGPGLEHYGDELASKSTNNNNWYLKVLISMTEFRYRRRSID